MSLLLIYAPAALFSGIIEWGLDLVTRPRLQRPGTRQWFREKPRKEVRVCRYDGARCTTPNGKYGR